MPITIPTIEIMPVLPQVIVALAAVAMLLLDAFVPRRRTDILAVAALLSLGAAAAAAVYLWGATGTAYSGMLATDNLTLYFSLVLLAGAALAVLLSWAYLEREGIARGEFYTLIMLAVAGMMLLVASNELLVVFLSLETLSLALYILVGFAHEQRQASAEAALKYFLLGAFSSAILLYGIALVYGATGTTSLAVLASYPWGGSLISNPLLLAGVVMITVGFGFKLAFVPFQMWTPDVYQGAPTPVTAFMSVATKAAAFAAFLRLVMYALPHLGTWAPILSVLAILTMILGNVAAIVQRNIKRMLAYSSIAHAGYILVAVVAGGELGRASVLFYLAAYTFMNVGAFAVVQALERREQGLDLGDYAGLARRAPWLAAAMALFMFSLAGFPPTAGFFAKFYVFNAAVQAGYEWLAVIGVLCSLLGVVYYVGVIVNMYMREPGTSPVALSFSTALVVTLVVAAVATLFLGLWPSPVLELARQAIAMLR